MKKHDHDHLAGEKPGNHMIQALLMVVFLLVWVVDSFFLRVTTILSALSPMWLNVALCIGVLSISAYYLNASDRDLFHTEDWGLKTKGVFSQVRNPMYLGIALFYLSLIILTLSLAALLVWLIICVYYDRLANYEEARLQEEFGEEFLQYKKSVRKWIPV